MKKIILFYLCIIIIAGLFCCGCENNETASKETEPCTAEFFAMDTIMKITVYGNSQVLADAEALVKSFEEKFSVTMENSEISKLNKNGTATLSAETKELVKVGLELCNDTNGALDISIYPVVKAWGFTTGNYKIPSDHELSQLLTKVDYKKITLNEADSTITIPANTEIDLGSIAKGFTGDCLISYFRENNIKSALINLGGNAHVLGRKPDGSLWRISIQNPLGEGNIGIVAAEDKAVVTSGGYERYFEQNGQTYWHIIDPQNGKPAHSGLVSVTVIGENGAMCDGLSTALFVMGLPKATAYWQDHNDFEAVFVTEDGQLYITEGLIGNFETADDYKNSEVNIIYND